MNILEIEGLRKSYRTPESSIQTVVDIASFSVPVGSQIALYGISGTGKTTFLNLIAGILRPDAGKILLDGWDMASHGESARDAMRAKTVGYIFQTFNLLQGYTALENVTLAMMFGSGPDMDFARRLLDRVGLQDRRSYLPRQLSAGQQQRAGGDRADPGTLRRKWSVPPHRQPRSGNSAAV